MTEFLVFCIAGMEGVIAIDRYVHSDGLLDFFQVLVFLAIAQSDAFATSTGSCRSANAVHVRFCFERNIKIDHMANVIDINAASGDIGGDKYSNLAIAKCIQDTLSGILRTSSVDAFCGHP